MNIPAELKYSTDHEWVKLEGDTATIGITDFAQKELGDIVFVDVTCEGDTLSTGDVFGTIEAVKTVSDLMLPMGGDQRIVRKRCCDYQQRSVWQRLDHQSESSQSFGTFKFDGCRRLQSPHRRIIHAFFFNATIRARCCVPFLFFTLSFAKNLPLKSCKS